MNPALKKYFGDSVNQLEKPQLSKEEKALTVSINTVNGVNPILSKYGISSKPYEKPATSTADSIFMDTPTNDARTNYINQRRQELEDEYAPLKNDRFGGLFKGKSSEEIEAIVNKNLQGYIKAYDKEQANKNKTIPTNSEDYKEFYKNDVLGDSNLPGFLKDFAANVGLVNTKLQQNPVTGRYIQAFNNNGQQEVTDDLGRTVEAPTTGNKIIDTFIDIPANVGANIVFNKGIGAGDFYKNTGVAADNLINRTGLQNPFLRSASREGVENALQEGLMSLSRGSDLGQVAKDTAIGGLQGAAFGGALEGAGRVVKKLSDLSVTDRQVIEDSIKKSPLLKQVKQVESQKPSSDIKGRFTIKNQSLEDAYKAYDDAVSTLQNAFGHYKLTPEEIIYGADELGIDLDQLLNSIDKAENTKISIGAMGERARMSRVAGANDSLIPKGLLNTSTPKSTGNNLNPLAIQDKNISMPASIDKVNDSLELPFQKASSKKTKNANLDTPLSKTSGFKTNTWRNSEILNTKEAQKVIDDIDATYQFKSNEESLRKATEQLNNNPDVVINRIRNSKSLNGAEDAVASGLITKQLREEAEQSGDYSKLKDWLETVQPKVTETAQSLQALSTWKKLTPEGTLMKAQQVVGKVNREGKLNYGKLWKNVDLTNDEIQSITETMNKIDSMEDGRPKDIEFAKVKQIIADKIPPTLSEKVASLQRISLLLNTKTMTRNVLGNVIMGGLENIKDIPGSLVDRAISIKTGKRTTLAPSFEGLGTQLGGLKKGFTETLEDSRLGINTSPSSGQFDLPQSQSFRKGVLGKLEKATSTGLTLGDRPFWQAAYNDSLRQQMKIANVKTPTEEMISQAKEVAEERTFQNVNGLVNGFKKIQSGLNEFGSRVGLGNENFGLGNFVLPFAKTPANILDKAIDYSPIGGFKGIRQLMEGIKKGNLNQKEVVDRLGRSLTGSSLIAAGGLMAREGLLTGQGNDNSKVAALEKQTGKTPYSIKIGDTYYSIDWAQPAAIPLMIGADAYYRGKDQKSVDTVIFEGIKSGGATLFNQSLLQGLGKLFSGYSSSPGENLVSGMQNTLLDIPTQFVPSALKQATQLTDTTSRDTYSPSILQTQLNKISTRIPGLSSSLQPRIDSIGREIQNFGGVGSSGPLGYGANVLFNPGYVNENNPTDAEKLMLDIYNQTGETKQIPSVKSKDYQSIEYKSNNGKETIQLTSKEKTDLQKYVGEKILYEYDKLYNSDKFRVKDKSTQAKELQSLLGKIRDDGEDKILKSRGLSRKE